MCISFPTLGGPQLLMKTNRLVDFVSRTLSSKMALHARYVSKGLDIKLLSLISKMPGYKAICSLTRVG